VFLLLRYLDGFVLSQSRLITNRRSFGGADGSIYLFDEAISRAENDGLQTIVKKLGDLAVEHGVSVADMIQWGAVHATVTCPLGPRIRTFVGRPDAVQPSPEGLLPSAEADSTSLIALFGDKSIPKFDMVALVGAHTVSKQFDYEPSTAGNSQDDTPGIWDTNFYTQTLEVRQLTCKIFTTILISLVGG
jgi:hypothetical protein